jgi:hypothetical protein
MSDEEYIDTGGDQVIVRVHQDAHGERSGAPVEGTFWFLFAPRSRKITGLHMYASKEQALEAAGLRE